jgi:DNA-binding response OmpR family regulator
MAGVPKVLVVDDAPDIVRLTRDFLEHAGFTVLTAGNGDDALRVARQQRPDLIVLDLGLPGRDGLDVTRELRKDSNVPIVMLTARTEESDKIVGLELGADDYLVKPFAVEELEARVRALIRRRIIPIAPEYRCGALRLDLVARQARIGEEPVELTGREWSLLEILITQPGVAVAKERFVQSLSSWDDRLTPNAVEVYVSRLRAKVERAGVRIRTVRGYGYLLEAGGA